MLSRIFGASVRLRNALYDSRRLRVRHLEGPVISVGNISVGGAGKTPLVIALGEMLEQRELAFDVLSRGYGRATKGLREVDPAGSAADFGDEPLLITRRLQVAVIVGERRYDAGVWSERKYGPRLHLLDDGFQHRQLARDFDIVLVTAADLNDCLLPGGRLREPLSSIRRADAVVIADDINPTHLPLHGDQMLWRLRRGIEILDASVSSASPSSSSRKTSLAQPAIDTRHSNLPLLAFCAIARPPRFFDDLRKAGMTVAAELPFPDHHRYTAADLDRLLATAGKSAAAGFVTTEKDLVNLGPLASRLVPLSIARVTLELLDARHAIDRTIETLVHRGKTP